LNEFNAKLDEIVLIASEDIHYSIPKAIAQKFRLAPQEHHGENNVV
jgi:hypothetical protein